MKKQPTDKLNTNITGMLLAVVGIGLLAVYVTIAFSARDALWFLTTFDVRPARITIYHDGQRTELQRGDPGFAELAEAVRVSLAEGVARPSGMGLSSGSLDDAYNMYVTLEAFFDQPVKLHATFNTDSPWQMLFPITGRHSDIPVVFLGVEGQYMAGAPVLKTIEPIRDVLRAQGYLK
jgi:hypothetical protein